MLEPIRTARVLGSLVLAQGAFFLLFWKTLAAAIATGMARYADFSGRMAKKFFSQDKALLKLLEAGETYLTPILILGLIVSFIGILMLAFPKQTVQILIALRILRKGG